MSQKRSDWLMYKKQLPKAWACIVANQLNSNKILPNQLTGRQVSAIRIGRIKNHDLQKAVWKEIKKLHNKTEKTKNQISKMKVV